MKTIGKLICVALGTTFFVRGMDNRLYVNYQTIESKNLPKEFDGFRIAHLSDYHDTVLPDLPDKVREAKVDIICITGDMVNDCGDYENAVKLIEELQGIAPVFMVTGNHDVWRTDFKSMENEITKTGAKFIHNETITLQKGDGEISISGIDDPYARDWKSINSFMNKAIKNVRIDDGYNILLFHRANHFDMLRDLGFDLILSGHMHGGMIRIPGLGGVGAPRSSMGRGARLLFPKYTGGRYCYRDTTMLVSCGLGNGNIIPRIYNPPELIIVTLKSQA